MNPNGDPDNPPDNTKGTPTPFAPIDATMTTPGEKCGESAYAELGTTIGRYKILNAIGAGGFGVVYLAEQQQPVRRQVALKILKLGMDTREVISRFEAERQALAMMEHPNIAKVLDAGATDTGRPYFVMELVKGPPITRYCDDHELSIGKRLRLFVDVCRAIQHAHQKGIIHRDIKPGNVLVATHDGKPVPRVIDFGIAKAIEQRGGDRSLATCAGQFMGTPAYMSPEQAAGDLDIDTRSDIYTLGVLLYELLTGTTPIERSRFESTNVTALQRMIVEQEPEKPSTRLSTLGPATAAIARRRSIEPSQLRRELRGDLDWIVMKTLEKDRARRYDTANALAMDVLRFLNQDPVLATPPSTTYRLRKFALRNRAAIAAMSALAVGLVFAVSALTFGFVTTRRERDEKERALEEATRQARIAEAVNNFLTEDLLAAVDPERTQNRDITVREVLDEAALRIGTRFNNEPLVAASIEHTLGVTYTKLGVYEPAEKHLRRAYELLTDLRGDRDRKTLSVRSELDQLRFLTGVYEQGIQDMEVSLATMRDTLGENDPITLRTTSELALLYAEQNQPDKAEPMYLRAIAGLEAALGPTHRDTLSAQNNLALLYADRRQLDQAEALLHSVYESLRNDYGEEDPNTLEALANIAHLYNEQERFAESKEIGVKLVETRRRIFGNEHPATLIAMNNLAIAYVQLGRFDLAEPLYREDFETSRRVLGAEHPGTLTSMTNLGRLYVRMERFDDAERILSECADLNRKVLPPGHIGLGITFGGLGESLFGLHRFDEAIPPLRESYEILLPIFGPDHFGTRRMIEQLGTSYEKTGDAQAAAEWRAKLADAEGEPPRN